MLWPRTSWLGDPWLEMHQLKREMNRLFDRAGWSRATEFPAVNVYTSREGALVTAELPGMDAKEIDISVDGNMLTIAGTRADDEAPEGATLHRQERGSGGFARSVQLPFRADPKRVEANYDRGVLRVTLEAAEEEKPRRIAVKSA